MPIAQNHVRAAVLTRDESNTSDNVNVLWYTYNVPVANADLQAFATAMATGIGDEVGPALKDAMPNTCSFVGVQLSVVQAGVTYTASSVSQAGLGSVISDVLPAYAAAVVQKRTAQPGRGGRGRWYIGAIPETFTDGSNLTPAGQTAIGDVATAFGTVITVGVWPQLQPSHVVADTTLFPLTGVRPLITLGTLRRRMVRPRF